ncbi:MAG: Rieske 2Fe-2S domain-containing protein [Blastocatellia bacterium]
MDSESREKTYRKVAERSEIPPGAGLKVVIDDDEIALFNLGGEFYALKDFCPHRGAPLSEGFLEDGKVFCPWHCFDFSLKTGESQIASHLRVATYPVKVEDGGSVFILY